MKYFESYLGAIKAAVFVALAFGLFWAGHNFGAQAVQAKWDAENTARATADNAAIMNRVRNNERITEQQQIDNQQIDKAHDDELAKVHADLVRPGRMRVGAALCGRSSAPTKAESPGNGNGADSGSRLLSPEMDAAVKSLIEETEKATAAGRACQAFIQVNGMVP